MIHDCRTKWAQYIKKTVDIRMRFSFAHPMQVLTAMDKYEGDNYGAMLYNLPLTTTAPCCTTPSAIYSNLWPHNVTFSSFIICSEAENQTHIQKVPLVESTSRPLLQPRLATSQKFYILQPLYTMYLVLYYVSKLLNWQGFHKIVRSSYPPRHQIL